MDHYIASSNHPPAHFEAACEYLKKSGFSPDPQIGCSLVFRGAYPLRGSGFDQPVSSVATLWKKTDGRFSVLVQCACCTYEENLAEQLHAEIVACGKHTTKKHNSSPSPKSGSGPDYELVRFL